MPKQSKLNLTPELQRTEHKEIIIQTQRGKGDQKTTIEIRHSSCKLRC